MRGEFLVAEGHAAEHGKAVADKRDDERHEHERGGDIAQKCNAAVHCREQKACHDADCRVRERDGVLLPMCADCHVEQEHHIEKCVDERRGDCRSERDGQHDERRAQDRRHIKKLRLPACRVQQLPRGCACDGGSQNRCRIRRQEHKDDDQKRHADSGDEKSLFHLRPPNRRSRVRYDAIALSSSASSKSGQSMSVK